MRLLKRGKRIAAYIIVFVLCMQLGVISGDVKTVRAEDGESWRYWTDSNGVARFRWRSGDWEYQVTKDNEVAIMQYWGEETDIVIPSKIDGMPVTSIGDHAFLRNATSVIMPDSVTRIGNSAFYECWDLTSVTIPDSVTSIGEDAFYACSNLTDITIPDSVTNIGSFAFYNCRNLTSVTISKSITSIKWRTFDGCTSLTNVTIPDSVTTIEGYAFSNCGSLSGVAISDSVTTIETCAFQFTPWLEEQQQKNSLVVLNNILIDASTCSGNVNIPDGVTSISGAFYNCEHLTSVTIPDSVTAIGSRTFYNCKYLTSIVIPDSVTTIEFAAFKGCENLTKIIIPDSVTTIKADAFYSCKNLTSVIISKSITIIEYATFMGCSSLTKVTIPDNVTTIEDYAFGSCESLINIVIPSSITSIERCRAFENTPWLENKQKENPLVICNNILIDGSTCSGDVMIPNGVTSIAEYAFSDCSNLTNITIPDSVAMIGDGAFSDCSNLTNITIPDSVAMIGDGAFSGCSNLTEITIPDSVNDIGSYAFRDTLWLENKQKENPFIVCNNMLIDVTTCSGDIIIPDGVTSIASGAFSNCENLTSITIPDEVTNIGDGAFPNGVNIIASANSYAAQYTRKLMNEGGINWVDSAFIANTKQPSTSEAPVSSDNSSAESTTASKPEAGTAGSAVTTESSNKDKKDKVTIPKVAKVTKFKATAKKKGFTVSWKKVSDASGYKLQISTKKNFKGANTYTINKSKKKYTLSKLKRKTKYYIRICAYKTYKGEDGKTKKVYGKYVSVSKKTK